MANLLEIVTSRETVLSMVCRTSSSHGLPEETIVLNGYVKIKKQWGILKGRIVT